ncbi:MAG: hypothetical protein ABIE43_01410 [Patescibacteria group bacterium]
MKRKIILTIILIIIVVTCAYYTYNYFISRNFTYQIEECDKTQPQKEDSIDITLEGNTMHFTQIRNDNCAINDFLKLKYTKWRNELTINEKFESDIMAMCNCASEIKGKISNLKPGKYNINFKYNNYLLKETAFEIK